MCVAIFRLCLVPDAFWLSVLLTHEHCMSEVLLIAHGVLQRS